MGPNHVRVALLLLAEQAFLGREDCAGAVDVDRATLEHDAGTDCKRPDFRRVSSFGHEAADFFVVTPVGIFGPRVKAKLEGEWLMWGQSVRPGKARLFGSQEDAAGVAHPHAVRGPTVEVDVWRE